MTKELTIPVHVHELKENDRIAEADHRKTYSLKRDLLAADFNRAIVLRLARDKEELDRNLREKKQMVTCAKCGNEYAASAAKEGSVQCPECTSPVSEVDLID
jgi:hypothetical protein